MNTTSKYLSRTRLRFASVAFTLAIAGCYETYEPPSPGETTNTGGSAATTGGTSAGGDRADTGGTESATGGTSEVTGGMPSGGGETAETGGRSDTGGTPSSSETGGRAATGGSSASGGSADTGGALGASGSSSGGAENTGGTTPAGGTPSTGGAPQGGAGGGPAVEESICVDESGSPVPYDFSFGIASEYAFELSMSCDVGGYLMPLVLADPEQLSEVNGFVVTATDWYRSEILNCPDESSALDKDSYGLLPASQSSDLSDADFDASIALFMSIIDRHDGQPDQVSAPKKDKIQKRIKSVKARAVHNHAAGLTKTLPETECVPAAPAGGGG